MTRRFRLLAGPNGSGKTTLKRRLERDYAVNFYDFLNADEASKMLTLLRMSVQNIHLFHMTRAERNRVTDLILQFYHIHQPAFHDLKSLAILREL